MLWQRPAFRRGLTTALPRRERGERGLEAQRSSRPSTPGAVCSSVCASDIRGCSNCWRILGISHLLQMFDRSRVTAAPRAARDRSAAEKQNRLCVNATALIASVRPKIVENEYSSAAGHVQLPFQRKSAKRKPKTVRWPVLSPSLSWWTTDHVEHGQQQVCHRRVLGIADVPAALQLARCAAYQHDRQDCRADASCRRKCRRHTAPSYDRAASRRRPASCSVCPDNRRSAWRDRSGSE